MNKYKILKKFLYPPVWVIILLTVISCVFLVFVFTEGDETSPFAIAAYVVSFYTLTALTLFFVTVFPKRYKNIKAKIYGTNLGNRYMTDAAFRTRISLYSSFFINMLYVAVNGISYILYRSYWFLVLAVYYIILAVMRFLLLRYAAKNRLGYDILGELRRSRLCSVILLTVNFVLSGAVLMILYQNKGYEYNGLLIYVIAAYTFYITAHAIINLIKYRKYKSPVMTMSKIISLSSALVSMLALETAMFSEFGGEMSISDQRLMIALTGAGVSITVITMSVYMIVVSVKEIRKIKESNIT